MMTAVYLHDVLVHSGIGAVFAGTGACVRGACDHLHHKLIVGGVLIFGEAAAMVYLVG